MNDATRQLLTAAENALEVLERCLAGANLKATGDQREAGVTEYQELLAAIERAKASS